MSTSPRLDLALKYTAFTTEILKYAKEVSRISIEQGCWKSLRIFRSQKFIWNKNKLVLKRELIF
jgi:hypothetical protein